MEQIKTSASGVEFDVIYDDGSRHRVKEGTLVEVCDDEVVWHNGTDRLSVVFASASCMLDVIKITGTAKIFAAYLQGEPESSRTVSVLREVCCHLFADGTAKQSVFRLGQMDMKASVCDMLRNLADGATDPVSAGLILAADLVESMEVPYADTGK